MPGWVSRFGLTWASAMVLVAAGIVNAFDAVTTIEQRRTSESAEEEGEAPAVARVVPSWSARGSGREHVVPVQRLHNALSVDLIDAWEGSAVEVRVTDCADEPIRLVRRGHGFPVKVYDLDPEARCTVQARRKDGVFWTRWTRPVRTSGASEVALALPDERAGGIGLRISARRGGAYVQSVEPWTPAWQAGVEPGDVLVAVDGQSLAGLSLDGMVERITGPEGSTTELGIVDVRSGRTVVRTVERRFMD